MAKQRDNKKQKNNNNNTKKQQGGKKDEVIRISIPGTDIILPDWDFEVFGMKFNIRPVVGTTCGFAIVNPKSDPSTLKGSGVMYTRGKVEYYSHEVKTAFVCGQRAELSKLQKLTLF
jgi:hypothetical protein